MKYTFFPTPKVGLYKGPYEQYGIQKNIIDKYAQNMLNDV
jgi:hypothetical protein